MTECYAGIPDEVLDSTWLDSDLARLSRSVVSWEELAPFWGLTEAEEEEIKRDNHSYAAQKSLLLCVGGRPSAQRLPHTVSW